MHAQHIELDGVERVGIERGHICNDDRCTKALSYSLRTLGCSLDAFYVPAAAPRRIHQATVTATEIQQAARWRQMTLEKAIRSVSGNVSWGRVLSRIHSEIVDRLDHEAARTIAVEQPALATAKIAQPLVAPLKNTNGHVAAAT